VERGIHCYQSSLRIRDSQASNGLFLGWVEDLIVQTILKDILDDVTQAKVVRAFNKIYGFSMISLHAVMWWTTRHFRLLEGLKAICHRRFYPPFGN
jgi:hypothetical protein